MERTIKIYCPNTSEQKAGLLERAKDKNWKVEERENGIVIHSVIDVTDEQNRFLDHNEASVIEGMFDKATKEPGDRIVVMDVPNPNAGRSPMRDFMPVTPIEIHPPTMGKSKTLQYASLARGLSTQETRRAAFRPPTQKKRRR